MRVRPDNLVLCGSYLGVRVTESDPMWTSDLHNMSATGGQ